MGSDLALSLTFTVTDDGSIASVRTTIGSGYQSSQDALIYSTLHGISGTFTAATGILSLSGTATPAQFTAALRSIRYRNTSNNPATNARTLNFQAIDSGGNASATFTRTDDR